MDQSRQSELMAGFPQEVREALTRWLEHERAEEELMAIVRGFPDKPSEGDVAQLIRAARFYKAHRLTERAVELLLLDESSIYRYINYVCPEMDEEERSIQRERLELEERDRELSDRQAEIWRATFPEKDRRREVVKEIMGGIYI